MKAGTNSELEGIVLPAQISSAGHSSPTMSGAFNSASCRTFIANPVDSASKANLVGQTMIFALFFVLLRWLIQYYTNWNGYVDLKDLTLVYTGLFFTTGILFSNVNQDLKETEKMPADLASSLEQLEDSYSFMHIKGKNIRKSEIYLIILKLIIAFKALIQDGGSEHQCFHLLSKIPVIASECDVRGGPGAAFMNAAVDRMRRVVARASVVSNTDVLPSAHGLLGFFVLASTVILFLSSYSSWVSLVMIMTCVYTVTWFCVRQISFIDDPFDNEMTFGMSWLLGKAQQVHCFPLDNYALRILQRQDFLRLIASDESIEEFFPAKDAEAIRKALSVEDFATAAFLVQKTINDGASSVHLPVLSRRASSFMYGNNTNPTDEEMLTYQNQMNLTMDLMSYPMMMGR